MSMYWGTRKLKPLPQVLVRDKNGIVHSFVAEELAQAGSSLFRNRHPGSIWIIRNEHTVPALMKLAKDKGTVYCSTTRYRTSTCRDRRPHRRRNQWTH